MCWFVNVVYGTWVRQEVFVSRVSCRVVSCPYFVRCLIWSGIDDVAGMA